MASSGPKGLEDVFLLTIFYVYGLVGIVVEVGEEWADRGLRFAHNGVRGDNDVEVGVTRE